MTDARKMESEVNDVSNLEIDGINHMFVIKAKKWLQL